MPFSTEVCENRAFVSEIKFFVPAERVDAVRSWARARLRPDPHGGGPLGDTYETHSLYFDSTGFDVFQRNGSFGRSKYRVRRYGDAEEVFLERKLKTRNLVSKRRSTVHPRELSRLADPETHKGWAGHWFHRRLLARELNLVCQVAYHRTALVHSNGHGPLRLTLDEDVRAATTRELAFQPLVDATPLTNGRAILELKFYHPAPAMFQELIAQFGLSPQPISKYRMAVGALGLFDSPMRSPGAPGRDTEVFL